MIFLSRLISTIIVLAVALVPLWLWLLVFRFADPHGFWQKIFLVGAGLYVLGAAQVIFGIIGLVLTIMIWTD